MKLSLSSIAFATSCILHTLAAPSTNSTELYTRANTPNSEGWNNGFFYSWWSDNTGTAIYSNGAGGQYSIQWNGNGEVIGGKGWNPGTWTKVINYSGTYQSNGNAYLAVRGWTRYPLTEYYVVESYNNYNPATDGQQIGSVTCNGANYDILTVWRNQKPSIDGIQSFQQVWSVRNPPKAVGVPISGTVNIACHFNAWTNLGITLGTSHNYQIVATEGFYSQGQASITVW